jgi:glyoxylase-like metal-dependent hydrolase (beta-lactamase superfamily II)
MRSLIKALFVVATSSALALAGCADAQSGTPPQAAASAEVNAPRTLGAFTSDAAGFDTHSFWLDTGREVVVFDAQFTETLAKEVIADIRAKTKSPIKYVVVTHPNPDKFNGASAFQAIGAKVVASEATAKAIPGVHAYKKYYFVNVAKSFTEETYPAQAKIDVTFSGDYELPLAGSFNVKLHELGHRGVSSTQTVAFVPEMNALVVGDLVHHKAHAWLEGGIVDGKPVPDLASWKLALNELRAYEGATVFGGRGQTAPVEDAVTAEQQYLDRMNALIMSYVAGLGAAKSELLGPKAGDHYKKIAALAAQEAPDYALPYMIEYGAYGLINQIAAK